MYLINFDQLPKEEIAMIKAIIIKAHAEIVFIVLGFGLAILQFFVR